MAPVSASLERFGRGDPPCAVADGHADAMDAFRLNGANDPAVLRLHLEHSIGVVLVQEQQRALRRELHRVGLGNVRRIIPELVYGLRNERCGVHLRNPFWRDDHSGGRFGIIEHRGVGVGGVTPRAQCQRAGRSHETATRELISHDTLFFP
jgi:hypothetical protein